MMLDNLFGKDNIDDNDKENSEITEGKPAVHNEQLEKEKEFKADQSNGKSADDASAHRNQGAGGYTQRSDQKDQLENLHIGGSETEPQGGNEHHAAGEQAQGPGFESEGSIELDHQLRTREQKFGEDAPSGPAKPVQD
ncbi:hypothetical protein KBK19_18315 [Microvirga sp. STR05]|uniref:Uncharacterized protein n=1 Tax=Hymenobacter duratus TaxID=2771356 RepID=A0ABR8JJG5_9BACT|nr:hypothetical protein [Hymenobacter duratus]MBD2717006.1 hypothetical protein [Hymenobacter duratus]MBR7951922.1 hypothetical protein [Microvirga sp. STR05]